MFTHTITIGEKFGKLTVQSTNASIAFCKCSCGRKLGVPNRKLLGSDGRLKVESCGCCENKKKRGPKSTRQRILAATQKKRKATLKQQKKDNAILNKQPIDLGESVDRIPCDDEMPDQ